MRGFLSRFSSGVHLLFERSTLWCHATVLVVFSITLTLGFLTSGPAEGTAAIPRSDRVDPAAFFHIVINNIRVLGLELAGIATAGFSSLLQVGWNGFRMGLLLRQHRFGVVAPFVFPHAIIEMSALLLGASTSLNIVVQSIRDGLAGRFSLIRNLNAIVIPIALCVALLLVAGLIEVFVTPWIASRFLPR